jgi:chloramphenicol 3-O phosphotransferase
VVERIARDALPARGHIVVLNGTSSAGKSSIAKALQARVAAPYLHVQMDAFRAMEPGGHWQATEHWPLRLAVLCRALHAACIEYADHGLNVILDHVLTPDAWHYLRDDLAEHTVYLVDVHCPLDEAVRRERVRADRPIGLAASQAAWIGAGPACDLTLDTGSASAATCADALARWLAPAPPPAAFERLSNDTARP